MVEETNCETFNRNLPVSRMDAAWEIADECQQEKCYGSSTAIYILLLGYLIASQKFVY